MGQERNRKRSRRGIHTLSGTRSSAARLLLGFLDRGDYDHLEPLRRQIDDIRYSGHGGEIDHAKNEVERVRAKLRSELSFEVLDALLGDLETMHGRWTGNRAELEQGLNRIESLVLYLQTKDLKHDENWRFANAQALNWLGNAKTRLAYLTRQHHDQRIAVRALEVALQEAPRRSWLLRADIRRNLGDALLAQMWWGERQGPSRRSLRVLRAASKALRGLIKREEDLERRRQLHVEYCAALSSLAVACMLVSEGISASPRSRYLSAEDRDALPSQEDLAEEAEVAIRRVSRLHRQAWRRGVRWFRDARTLSDIAFAASFLLRSRIRASGAGGAGVDRIRGGAEEAFEHSCELYGEEEHPFRYAVTREGWGDLYRDLMLSCSAPSRRLEFAEAALSHYEVVRRCFARMRGADAYARARECAAKERYVKARQVTSKLTSFKGLWYSYVKLDIRFLERKIAQGIGDRFADAVAQNRERLAARKAERRALQEADAEDIQALINEAKLNLPVELGARQRFVDEVTRELKAAGLVLRVGEETATGLVLHKGSIACTTDKGTRGFLRPNVRVVRRRGVDDVKFYPEVD